MADDILKGPGRDPSRRHPDWRPVEGSTKSTNHVQAVYNQLSAEQRAVLKKCGDEARWYGGFPGAALGGLLYFALNRAHILAPTRPFVKALVFTATGYVAGMTMKIPECRLILQDYVQEFDARSGVDVNPYVRAEHVDEENRRRRGNMSRTLLQGEDRFDGNDEPDEYSELAPGVTHDELRKRNRVAYANNLPGQSYSRRPDIPPPPLIPRDSNNRPPVRDVRKPSSPHDESGTVYGDSGFSGAS